MPFAPNLQSLLDEALTRLPALSRHVQDATQDALAARPQYFELQDSWRRLRPRFATDFEAALLPLLQAARRGEDPLQRRSGGLDALSLVDEQQALQDIAIAQAIQAIEQASKVELHQLDNFFAALRGTARARSKDNPLRPALFAQALYQALFGTELDAQRRYALMEVAATPLGAALHRLYAALCERLSAADLSQLVAGHAARLEDSDAQQRFARARLPTRDLQPTEPASFDGLAQRVLAYNSSRPQPLDAAPGAAEPGAPDMLSRLYQQILADPRLLPPIRQALARLQVAVVRLSRRDPSLLRSQDHPAWRLLNRVAAHGMGFEHEDEPGLQGFLRFIEAELQLLIDTPAPSALLFQQVLARVEQQLSSQAQQRSERSAGALAALEREQLRPQWLKLVREQIDAQLIGAPLGPRLRRFLQTRWVEVIVQAMVQDGRDAPRAHAAIDLVDQLLDSLQPDASGTALRQRLPALIQGLRAGCDAIGLTEPQREPVLQELMQQHARLLRGQSALPPRAAAESPAPDPAPDDELLQRLLHERESQLPEHWAHTKVDRSRLPTVPVQLYAQNDSPDARAAAQRWLDAQQVGGWYHLFVQSQWLTAQLAWVGESRQFFLFVGQDPEQRHSMTRGALQQLLANGLIAALDDTGVVERAVQTLMQDLDDAR
ncbi:DUF1631 family protein [Roseateles violae]|uniref:DUF1631 family protein n=1 Tax=Roseateles violae TaxID=3058042 RepID=A0ABT8DW09_9BURK|nr:DUF1631 family protein [Pelomonas sp. PFR6]MDN3922450.1 DUF1631 family protein [Pelomonas sp. PFR6]